MMRPFTLLCLFAALGAGFYLFQTKNQAMLLDREIVRTMKQADATRQRTGLLRAEYALLNDPGRLTELAAMFLPELKHTPPSQFSGTADLDRRLPAIGAPSPPQPLEPQAPNAVVPKAIPVRVEPAKAEPVRIETPKPPAPRLAEIGRASCRERV